MRATEGFIMKSKVFFINFKALSLNQIKQYFLEGESWTLTIEFYKSFAVTIILIF